VTGFDHDIIISKKITKTTTPLWRSFRVGA